RPVRGGESGNLHPVQQCFAFGVHLGLVRRPLVVRSGGCRPGEQRAHRDGRAEHHASCCASHACPSMVGAAQSNHRCTVPGPAALVTTALARGALWTCRWGPLEPSTSSLSTASGWAALWAARMSVGWRFTQLPSALMPVPPQLRMIWPAATPSASANQLPVA